jgi:hypothetical protein
MEEIWDVYQIARLTGTDERHVIELFGDSRFRLPELLRILNGH